MTVRKEERKKRKTGVHLNILDEFTSGGVFIFALFECTSLSQVFFWGEVLLLGPTYKTRKQVWTETAEEEFINPRTFLAPAALYTFIVITVTPTAHFGSPDDIHSLAHVPLIFRH